VKRALLVVAALAAAPLATAQDLAIQAGNVVVHANQAPLQGATVLIRKGKVVAVGKDVKVPKGIEIVRRPKAWIVPGFVDARVALGLRGDLDERATPVSPDVDLAVRLDPGHADYAAARRSGITTAALLAGDGNLFSGAGVLLKTTGNAFGSPIAKLALAPSVQSRSRPPTSRSGAVALLRKTLEKAHSDKGSRSVLARFARGDVVGLCAVGGAADLRELLALRDRFGLRVVLQLRSLVRPEEIADLNLKGTFVALGATGLKGSRRARTQAKWLAARGARVLFVSGYPHTPVVSNRISAHHAVQAGLPAKQALAALTTAPAAALGISDQVGSLEVGRHGDLVVLSGAPLDLRSRVQEVYVLGKRTWSHPAKEER
jgi:imidazolonepropionase-like amidohydrolase